MLALRCRRRIGTVASSLGDRRDEFVVVGWSPWYVGRLRCLGERWHGTVAGHIQGNRGAHKWFGSRGWPLRAVVRWRQIEVESSWGFRCHACERGYSVGPGRLVFYSGSTNILAAWWFLVLVFLSWLRDRRD